jgi:alpha-glucosidase
MSDNAESSAKPPEAARPATKSRRPAKPKAAPGLGSVAQPSNSAPREHPVLNAAFSADWWQRGVVYQVYPRSFADSNADGIGDLPGLIDKLDYLNDGSERSLGIDAIWLSPIHPSPGFDVGYDVADYDAIDPIFGTLDDFDRLVAEAHRRGIRVMLDLVMNHTSSAHHWFEESRRDPTGPRSDWYLWRDGSPGRFGRTTPPNNWRSFFGGSAWTWDEVRGQFYMHTFLPEQPDLNWRNPAVREAMLTMVRGWLDRGVDGFRLDVFNAFFKNADLLSNPRRWRGRRPYDRQVHLYDKDQPELVDLLAEFRALVDSYPQRMTVGELFSSDPAGAVRLSAPRHLVFDWHLIRQPWKARDFADASDEHERMFGASGWPTIVLSNHDQPRQASRLAPGADAETSDAIAKAAAALSLTLRGTPYLYYGEEIGARDVPVPWKEIIDPPARRGGRLVRRLVPWWNRDQARSPMPWGGGPNGGFSGARPWLRMAPDADTRTVANQEGDPSSVLNTYRSLLWLRRRHPALQVGAFRRLPTRSDDVFAYERSTGGETLIVAVNFSAAPRSFRIKTSRRWKPLFSTHATAPPEIAEGDELTLRSYEAVILHAG